MNEMFLTCARIQFIIRSTALTIIKNKYKNIRHYKPMYLVSTTLRSSTALVESMIIQTDCQESHAHNIVMRIILMERCS